MAATSPAPRSIMRRLNGFIPSSPSRRPELDDNAVHRITFHGATRVSPPPSTPRRRSVQFSPAPAHVFETYSPADYDRTSELSPPRPGRSGHLDNADLALFRQNISLVEPRTSASTVSARSQGRLMFSLDDPFEDASSDSDLEGEIEWRSSTPILSSRSPRPIPRLQLNSPGSDSEEEDVSVPRPVDPVAATVAGVFSQDSERENRVPVAFLATAFSSLSIPTPENVWPTPAGPETRAVHFEDLRGQHGNEENIGHVLMPGSPSGSIPVLGMVPSSPGVVVPRTPQTPSRHTLNRPSPTSPTLSRSPVANVLHVPSTPTRSKPRTARTPPRPALSPRENFPKPLQVNSSTSLTRGFRTRLLQNRQRMSDAGLGVIDENEANEN